MNKKIKNIAIVCHDHNLSGANKSLLDWITTANRNKYKIICVIPRKNKQFEAICKDNNIELIRANYIIKQKHLFKLNPKGSIKNAIGNVIKIFINPISFMLLKNKLKKRNVELIHSNSFATTLGVKLAIKMQIPHLWHVREFMEEDHKITHFESKEKIKKYCEYSDAVFISDVIKNKYDKLFSDERKNVIYNKIKFDETYDKKRKFGQDNKYNIIIAGALNINKGQMDAIMAVQELKKQKYENIKLYICGIGNEENKLKTYVKDNNLQDVIEFKGHLDNLTEFRKEIDIALVCSKSEALGRVTVEGMYYKNLIIGANAGCTPYIITDNQTGVLYKTGNYQELADKIKMVIKNKEKYVNIMEEAKKEAIKRFYQIEYDNKIFEIYDKILVNN